MFNLTEPFIYRDAYSLCFTTIVKYS